MDGDVGVVLGSSCLHSVWCRHTPSDAAPRSPSSMRRRRIVCWASEHGYLRGALTVVQGTRQRLLIDIIMEAICHCQDDPGENVQLQVIKALVTAISSNLCQVHGESLLFAVRACYNIYLVSKYHVNKTTAKAGLTQMMNIVFQRMEAAEQRMVTSGAPAAVALATAPHAPDAAAGAGGGAGTVVTAAVASPSSAIGRRDGGGFDGGSTSTSPAEELPNPDAAAGAMATPVVDRSLNGSAHARRSSDVAAAERHTDTPPQVDDGEDEVEGERPRDVSAHPPAPAPAPAPAPPGAAAAATPTPVPASAAAPLSVSVSAAGPTAAGTPMSPRTADDADGAGGSASFRSPAHRDAFLLFRALCNLSMKDDEEEGGADDATDMAAVQSKILSLELLLSALERSGPAFRSGPRFIDVIRKVRASASASAFASAFASCARMRVRVCVRECAHVCAHVWARARMLRPHRRAWAWMLVR